MAGGRPSKYKREFVGQAMKLAALGATDREAADFFNVSEATLNRWKQAHPEFCASLKVGKESADDRVEQSLYRKATGYSFDAEKIFQYEGQPVRVEYVEHVPPSDTAMIFWLKNRRPEQWRDKTEQDINVKGDLAERLMRAERNLAAGRGVDEAD